MTTQRRPSATGLMTAAAAAGFGFMATVDGIGAALVAPPLPPFIAIATLAPEPLSPAAPVPAPSAVSLRSPAPVRLATLPPPAAVPVPAVPVAQLEAVPPELVPLGPLGPGGPGLVTAETVTMPVSWDLSRVTITASDREALGRVAFAEAAGQGEAGIAAVVFTILNRVASGRFETDVQAVIDAPGQFEPVMRAGGSWRNLPRLSEDRRLVFATILNLIVDGRLPDPTNGAIYFQNAAIVAARAAAGQVRPSLVHFGGQTPIAVIRDHSFYGDATGAGGSPATASATPVPIVTERPEAPAENDTTDADTAGAFEAMLRQGGGDLFAPIMSAGEPAAGTNQAELFVPVDQPRTPAGPSQAQAPETVAGPVAGEAGPAPVYIESAADPARSIFVP